VQISARQWQDTFDAINDGVLLLDPDGQVAQVNQAMEQILGVPWNEIIGQGFHDLLAVTPDPDDPPSCGCSGRSSARPST
jgi:PAS domain S-box-containing protein